MRRGGSEDKLRVACGQPGLCASLDGANYLDSLTEVQGHIKDAVCITSRDICSHV